MKEIVFLNTNRERWNEFEDILNSDARVKPDMLSDLYIQLTDDLAFARSNYPQSNTVIYLNNLAVKAHQLVYKNKKIKNNLIITFWKQSYPLIVWESRKQILISFVIFFVSILIGIISSAYDDSFVRMILGDSYVNMTLSNIEKNDPMAVYKQVNEIDMFLGISLNNIYVAFLAFIFGFFLSFGTGYILLSNGIMLGAFSYFFYQKGLLIDSLLTIWIHGTIEIFAIIVAGGAGIVMGNSILFPGTYSRLMSFRLGVTKGIKLVFGLIPFFLIAGFLEGFVTRHTELPNFIRLIIILLSLCLIIFYFFIYPYLLQNKHSIYGRKSL